MRVPHLFPTTLTTDEQRLILRATAENVRDHTIISLALGTGLRLAEVVGLDVGDVFAPDGTLLPRQDPTRDRQGWPRWRPVPTERPHHRASEALGLQTRLC